MEEEEKNKIIGSNEVESLILIGLTSYQGHKISNLINPIEDINKSLQIWSGTQELFDMLTEVDYNKYLYFIKDDNTRFK